MSHLMAAPSKGSLRSGTYREYKFSGTIERRKTNDYDTYSARQGRILCVTRQRVDRFRVSARVVDRVPSF